MSVEWSREDKVAKHANVVATSGMRTSPSNIWSLMTLKNDVHSDTTGSNACVHYVLTNKLTEQSSA